MFVFVVIISDKDGYDVDCRVFDTETKARNFADRHTHWGKTVVRMRKVE